MFKPQINVHLPPLAKTAMNILVVAGVGVAAYFVIKHYDKKRREKGSN